MPIPEQQLDTWSHQGSITQSKETYATIKRVLEAPDTKYAGKNFEVFLQGSYGNGTNIYAESDVDVVIRLDSTYFSDTSGLTPEQVTAFNAAFIPATYPYADFKTHVVAALKKAFGATSVKADNKAVKIKPDGNRRSADVVVAAEFRRYYSGLFGMQHESGICFFTPNGRIENYPKQHSANCTAKHQATNGWFKPMVRILKNMRGKLVENGVIEKRTAPSYFIEGLLYNVPGDKFGKNYGSTFLAAMNWLFDAERNEFVCANKQHYLVRDSFATCWPCADYDRFLNSVASLWNDW